MLQPQGGRATDSSRCVVERGRAAVYVDVVDLTLELMENEEQGWWLASPLGAPPRSMLAVHIGHASGSNALAAEVVRYLVDSWGGVIDPESDGLAALVEP